MKNLLALGAAALVTFAVVGWYLDWYRIHTVPAGTGRTEVTIDVNNAKIKEDISKGKAKLREILDKDVQPTSATVPPVLPENPSQVLQPPPSSTPANTPLKVYPFQNEEYTFVLPGNEQPLPPPAYAGGTPPKQK